MSLCPQILQHFLLRIRTAFIEPRNNDQTLKIKIELGCLRIEQPADGAALKLQSKVKALFLNHQVFLTPPSKEQRCVILAPENLGPSTSHKWRCWVQILFLQTC